MTELKNFDGIIHHEEGKGFKSLTGKSIIIDFYADWCEPCKVSGPAVRKISEEMSEVDAYTVNIVENPELAAVFNIQAIPTFIVITPQGKVATKTGWEDEYTFKKFIQNSIITNEADK
jgi:thioredoxin